MREWAQNLRTVHSIILDDVDFVVMLWKKQYRALLQEFTIALVNSNSCWLSKFDLLPILSASAVIERSPSAVRPPVFGWDRSIGRYIVYERTVDRWRAAGWTKGTQLRTMKQQQRGRGVPVASHAQHPSNHNVPAQNDEAVAFLVASNTRSSPESAKIIVKVKNGGLSNFCSKTRSFFHDKLTGKK